MQNFYNYPSSVAQPGMPGMSMSPYDQNLQGYAHQQRSPPQGMSMPLQPNSQWNPNYYNYESEMMMPPQSHFPQQKPNMALPLPSPYEQQKLDMSISDYTLQAPYQASSELGVPVSSYVQSYRGPGNATESESYYYQNPGYAPPAQHQANYAYPTTTSATGAAIPASSTATGPYHYDLTQAPAAAAPSYAGATGSAKAYSYVTAAPSTAPAPTSKRATKRATTATSSASTAATRAYTIAQNRNRSGHEDITDPYRLQS